MIINTGGRTDTVQYFSEWLLERFRQGYALSRNPMFPDKVTRYNLTPGAVDCVVFCSKNYEPILPRLHEITDRFSTYFYYTITAYGKDVEPGVPDLDKSIDTLLKLERQVGRERITWRYDPVLLTKRYTVRQHLITFEHMASRLQGHVNECVFSFVDLYKKLQFNFPEMALLTEEDMEELAEGLGRSARKHGMRIRICASGRDYSRYGILSPGCMTLDILGAANGLKFKDLKHKGMRPGCRCITSHDIGAYDTCMNGCKYCYANSDPLTAQENFKKHDPHSPMLLGSLQKDDVVRQGQQRSFLDLSDQQMDLF